MRPWVTVGRVRGAFGIQGALKIEPFSPAESSVLLSSRHWMLIEEPPAGGSGVVHRIGARPFPLPAKVEIATVKPQGDAIIALLKSPLSREAASSLKGVAIQVERSDFRGAASRVSSTGPISSVVPSRNRTGEPLGMVSDIDDHGAQQLLNVDSRPADPVRRGYVLRGARSSSERLLSTGPRTGPDAGVNRSGVAVMDFELITRVSRPDPGNGVDRGHWPGLVGRNAPASLLESA